MYRASNVHYELSERSRGLDTGGIGAMHRLAKHVGLVEELDQSDMLDQFLLEHATRLNEQTLVDGFVSRDRAIFDLWASLTNRYCVNYLSTRLSLGA